MSELAFDEVYYDHAMNLPPHSASSLVVVVVITLLPSDATQLRSLMGQLEPRNTYIHWLEKENKIL